MAGRRTGAAQAAAAGREVMPEYVAAVDDLGADRGPLIIGGKSMGGRVASMVADELFAPGRIAGLLCLGYPFHPPGKPDAAAHRAPRSTSRRPALICQGTRDEFGVPRRGRELRAVARDRGALARGRRPRPQAAQGGLGLHRRPSTCETVAAAVAAWAEAHRAA